MLLSNGVIKLPSDIGKIYCKKLKLHLWHMEHSNLYPLC